MAIKKITNNISVSPQISKDEVASIAEMGFKSFICNRPDNEGEDQTNFAEIEATARQYGISCHYLPVVSGQVSDADAKAMSKLLATVEQPVLAYCRTGTRCIMLWALDQAITESIPIDALKNKIKEAGYNLDTFLYRFTAPKDLSTSEQFDVVIVGGGTSGISVAASILKRDPSVKLAIIEPSSVHYYQPAWTLVGGGCYDITQSKRDTNELIPRSSTWIRERVEHIYPNKSLLQCTNGKLFEYKQLIVACGLILDWDSIEGAKESLGKNGVTSNYSYKTAPYTFECVKSLKSGTALFTQPPMPIKCAGAPQKAMYLSGDYWHRNKVIDNIDIEFCNTGEVLFGVQDYVPALMDYVTKYKAKLNFKHQLIKVDGKAKKAWFKHLNDSGESDIIEKTFDMIHITPPQKAPDFIAQCPLADAQGWVDVDQNTLQHKKFNNVWAVGDVSNSPNAKTAAAARAQAPVVANNVLHAMGNKGTPSIYHYNGYGSCPLTVEQGKIVLAEFGYGGKLLPSFPKWLMDGTKATRSAWILKKNILPPFYWSGMLKGREWLTTKLPVD